ANRPGVELDADVPDVRPFLASAALLAVPLRVGGGSRLKILEALAAGVPVVSTRVGAEGLHLQPCQHLTLADTPVQMAREILEIMKHPATAAAHAERGRQQTLDLYDWAGLSEQLDAVWGKAVGVTFSLQNQLMPSLV